MGKIGKHTGVISGKHKLTRVNIGKHTRVNSGNR